MALLRIFRRYKDKFVNLEAWAKPISLMLDSRNLGVLSSVASLLCGLVKLGNPSQF